RQGRLRAHLGARLHPRPGPAGGGIGRRPRYGLRLLRAVRGREAQGKMTREGDNARISSEDLTMTAAMTMTIERVRAFNGLDVLVARDEGLFAAENLDVRMVALPVEEMRSAVEGALGKPATDQGKLQDRGRAAMSQG